MRKKSPFQYREKRYNNNYISLKDSVNDLVSKFSVPKESNGAQKPTAQKEKGRRKFQQEIQTLYKSVSRRKDEH